MSRITVKSDKIILPSGLWKGYITAEKDKIIGLSVESPLNPGECVDASGLFVSPGFIDIHCHGGGGHDFMDGGSENIAEAAFAHLRHGTTTLVPTALSSDISEVYRFLDDFHGAVPMLTGGPFLPGVHLEGPYINKNQAGAQNPEYIKNPCPDEYKKIIAYGRGSVIRWSFAPELAGSLEMGDYLYSLGISPSIAHSDANYHQVEDAFNHHFKAVTHLYSCMSTIVRKNGYRYLGVTESAYLLDDLYTEIIADGHHLPIELLQLIYKIKRMDRIILVTDSMRAAGMPEGEYLLGSLAKGMNIIVENGVAKLPDRSAFAGSVATTDRLVYVMHKSAGLDIVNVVKMITSNPARLLGIENKKGAIAAGLDCDLVLFNDNIEIQKVITSSL